MRSICLIIILLVTNLNVYSQVNLKDRGKGFYIDNKGLKHEGILVLKFAKYFFQQETNATLKIKYKNGSEEVLDNDKIQSFMIGKTKYITQKEISITAFYNTQKEKGVI